jgi:hypothetical protein
MRRPCAASGPGREPVSGRVPGVAFEPPPGDTVAGGGFFELPPQIIVLHCLPVCGAPVLGFPPRQPLGDAPAQIFRTSEKCDLARFFEALKRRDGGLQLHAIVGDGRLPTSQLAHVIAIPKQRSPTAGPRVSIIPAVSVDRYLLPTATFRHAQNLCLSVLDPKVWTKLSLQ